MGFPCSSVDKYSAYSADTRVQFLGREDPLEKEMATPSGILAWRIPWIVTCPAPLSTGLQESAIT